MVDLPKPTEIKQISRDERQSMMGHFVKTRFGHAVYRHRAQNAARVFSDAVEMIKLNGITEREAQMLMHNVYVKEPNGETHEGVIGSVGAALLAIAECCGLSADRCENNQVLNLMQIPMGFFKKQARNLQAEFDAKEEIPGEKPIIEEMPKKVSNKRRKSKMN